MFYRTWLTLFRDWTTSFISYTWVYYMGGLLSSTSGIQWGLISRNELQWSRPDGPTFLVLAVHLLLPQFWVIILRVVVCFQFCSQCQFWPRTWPRLLNRLLPVDLGRIRSKSDQSLNFTFRIFGPTVYVADAFSAKVFSWLNRPIKSSKPSKTNQETPLSTHSTRTVPAPRRLY